MRLAALLSSVLLLLGCVPVESVVMTQTRVPRSSGITLHILGADVAGVEHALSSTLLKAGYQPYSSAIKTVVVTLPSGESVAKEPQADQEITRKYQTPYLCQVKVNSVPWGARVRGFSLQLIEVATGKILVSINGPDGNYVGEDIAKALMAQLDRMGS